MNKIEPAETALIVIDMQRGFEEIAASGLHRNNPQAEERTADLLAAFRLMGMQVVHVRHASEEEGSVFRPERPGYAVMPCAAEKHGEAVIAKRVNSAFIGTSLEAHLRGAGIVTLVIVGATTNHCVETTTRMAGNLGFRALLVRDATFTFDRVGIDGERHRAEDVHAMTLSNLSGEFAEIVTAETVIRRMEISFSGADA